MNLWKQFLGFSLISTFFIATCTGCADSIEHTSSPTPSPAESPASVRDLNGMNITIGSWSAIEEPEVKASAQDEALWEYRNDMMKKHNFTITQESVGKWNTTLELMSTSSLAGDPSSEVFHIFTTFVPTAIENGLCYDLSTLDSIDLNAPKWDPIVREVASVGDSVYGIFPQQTPAIGIFFNKRLFEEAGLDPELPYDLQASGEWTWENFEIICEQLTRDIDHDGINDVYAINELSNRFFMITPLANGGRYVDVDANGKFVANYHSPETIEAFEWVTDFLNSPYTLYPENWQGQEELFSTAKTAMYIGDQANVMNFLEMEDDYGFVVFPKGPSATDYTFSSVATCWLIPSSYTKTEAENIAFALDIWSNPAPGYDGPDDWKMEQYKLFRDSRAVDETLVLAREEGILKFDYMFAMAGIDLNAFSHPLLWGGETVASSLESVSGIWDAAIAKANGEQ